ncbi:MAG: hypothetical protein SXA11_07360 [Cyanobacteriota bacterium]|nr:hypothetical protein [Cyanobacteriota bacterium]
MTIKVRSEDLPAYSNLTFKYIKGAGFGKQRRNESEYTAGQRAIAFANWLIQNHRNPGILDHKIHLKNYEGLEGLNSGYYGHDSRGSNKFQHCDALALMGEFWSNIGAKLAEFETLTGEIVGKDDGRFKAWLRDEMAGEMLAQAVGRLRSHRRIYQQLVCYLIGDSYSLEEITRYYPGAKIEVLEMTQVCLEASPKKEQKVAGLTRVISLAVAKEDKPGRNAVAKQLQWSVGQVSKLAGCLGQKIGISCGWDELIRVVTNVWEYIKTFMTGRGDRSNLSELELLVVELFFPGLHLKAIAPETAIELIYLAYQEYGFDLGKIMAFLWERSLKNAINSGLANNANFNEQDLDLLNLVSQKP